MEEQAKLYEPGPLWTYMLLYLVTGFLAMAMTGCFGYCSCY